MKLMPTVTVCCANVAIFLRFATPCLSHRHAAMVHPAVQLVPCGVVHSVSMTMGLVFLQVLSIFLNSSP